MAQYACLNNIGLIADSELSSYFSDGSRLTGLSEAHVPGIEVNGGSLGQGIAVATGIAMGKLRSGSCSRIYCIVGDGEINEGSAWESLLISAHQNLSNFTVIIDANGLQAMGRCEEVLGLEPLVDKLKAFNFEVRECDGHSIEQVTTMIHELNSLSSKRPRAIVARTVKGKGVSFMENNNSWHYTRLTAEAFKSAMEELRR